MISNFHVIFSNLKVAFHDNSNFPYLKCFFIELGILDWHGHWLGPRLTRVTMLNVLQIWKIIFSIVPLRRNINTHFVFIFYHARRKDSTQSSDKVELWTIKDLSIDKSCTLSYELPRKLYKGSPNISKKCWRPLHFLKTCLL